VRVALAPGPGQSGLLCELGADGSGHGPSVLAEDLAAAVREYERSGRVRWVWSATAQDYPVLLRAGVRAARCHDVTLTEGLLLSRDGRPSQAPSVATAWAVLQQAQAAWRQMAERDASQEALFERASGSYGLTEAQAALDALVTVHADQLARIAGDERPAAFGMLVAAESAGGLVAAEMSLAGLPWQPGVHDALLTGMLGRRPAAASGLHARSAAGPAMRPARLTELAAQISAAFASGRPVNPDSPSQVIRALAADGVRVSSTRLSVLREVDHPAVPLLLEYKELSRLYGAFGWTWLDTWVSGGRFRPEYVVGGVVSGRWASRGGGALQIPKVLRRAVVADPGWVLVVADAAQLEPRVLAALAGDRAFAEAAAGGDLYAALAGAFGGDRAKAKLALLSAMYGGAGGEAGQLLAVLRRRFPDASRYVEAAARAGEEGKVVRSVLGRSCPAPSARWRAITEESGDPDSERDPEAGRASRARGRFTRNFVVQASAADWALVLLAGLRARLALLPAQAGPPDAGPGPPAAGSVPPAAGSGLPVAGTGAPPPPPPAAGGPHLVFFQHDEVIVHCPESLADQVVAAVTEAAGQAARLVFGETRVAFPMTTAVVSCYADAK
jgi:DNA polymerase-1